VDALDLDTPALYVDLDVLERDNPIVTQAQFESLPLDGTLAKLLMYYP